MQLKASEKEIEEKSQNTQSVQSPSEERDKVSHSPNRTSIRKRMMHLHSMNDIPIFRSESVVMQNFEIIMGNNRVWAKSVLQEDPNFFSDLAEIQQPEFLWIGCSDSRVPANEICGLKPGEVFVHRNIANQAPPSDINVLAVIQYSVQVLHVKDIIVTGHYGCGGIKAAFKQHDHGPLQAWLSHIRDLRWRYRKELVMPTAKENEDLLCELNVKQQVYNIARIPSVQEAWKQGFELRIHGLVYGLHNGLLNDLGLTLSKIEHLPKEFRIF